jgi:hypothetical protein
VDEKMNYLLRIGAVYAVVVLVLGAALFALLPDPLATVQKVAAAGLITCVMALTYTYTQTRIGQRERD